MTGAGTDRAERRTRGRLAVAVVVLFAFVAGWWAATETLARPEDPTQAAVEYLSYTVVEDTVGSSVTLTGVSTTPRGLAGSSLLSGTVTSVDYAGGTATNPTKMLTVDLKPVMIAEGDTPAFRDLAVGAEGPDVEQLEQLLAELGHLTVDPNAVFDTATRRAVQAWQRDLGTQVTGRVEMGTLLFVGELPRPVVLDETVTVGARVQPDDPLVYTLADEPELTVTISSEQRDLAPVGTAAVVKLPSGDVAAEVTGVREGQAGQLELVVGAQGGGSLCSDADCPGLRQPDATEVPVELVTVPYETGPVVPVAALFSTPSGDVRVELDDGSEREVEILTSAGGLAVLSGVDVGDVVRVPTGEAGS